MKHLLCYTVLMFLYPSLMYAAVIRIPQDYPTIQAGINAAQRGDTVLVAAGSYTGTHRIAAFRDSISVCLAMKPGIVVMSEAGPDFTTITNDTAFVIVYIAGIKDTTAVIKGFTIQGSFFGIFCANLSAPLIENNIILPLGEDGLGIAIVDSSLAWLRGNIIQGYELGVNIEGASPTFVNNLFELNNSALRIESSRQFDPSLPVVLSNLFRNNAEGFESTTEEVNAFVSQNIFVSNETGAAIDQGNALLTRNIFANNQFAVRALSHAILVNNTMFGDSVGVQAGGFLAGADSLQIYNTIIWNSRLPIDTSFFSGILAVNYSDVQGGWAGNENINQDPLFVHPDTLNFQLGKNSPCIDAGNDTILTLQGDTIIITKFQGNEPDIGAIESPWVTSVNVKEMDMLDHLVLYPNYPNPFNPATTIQYRVPQRSKVTLKIYNMIGQEIRTLANGEETAGLKSVLWDGHDDKGNKVASGIYLYRIQVDNFVKAEKAVLAK